MSSANNLIETTPRPWWREGYVWLVISGPLTVVIAGTATMFMAYEGSDPVIPRSAENNASRVIAVSKQPTPLDFESAIAHNAAALKLDSLPAKKHVAQ